MKATMKKTDAHVAALLVASELVTDQQAKQCLKTITPHVMHVAENHPTPDGDDVSRMLSIWLDVAWLKIIMATFDWTGKDIVSNVFKFRTTHKPQRKLPNEYLPLKSHVKLAAVAVALLTGDNTAYHNSNKYVATIVGLTEATGQSEIANERVYEIYGANSAAIDALCDNIESDEWRATLKSKALWKSQSTASTQRPTSAWLLQMFGAGENRGNDKTIVADKSSEFYQALLALFFEVKPA